MPFGPGRYDKECVRILDETEADCVLVLVMGGKSGSGFSTAAKGLQGVFVAMLAPQILRDVADEIEKDLQNPTKHDA